jgi:hypothetical protein
MITADFAREARTGRVGRGNAVHVILAGGAYCGASYRRGLGANIPTYLTTEQVTCRKCQPVAAEIAELLAPAQPEADELDSLTFAELMVIAKQLQVPGRGTARIGALREGIRAARAAA